MSLMTSNIMVSSIFLEDLAKPMRRALSHITLMMRGMFLECLPSKDIAPVVNSLAALPPTMRNLFGVQVSTKGSGYCAGLI